MNQQIPLEIGTELKIQSENGGSITCRIEEVIGYGGSCIVYRGKNLSAGQGARTQIIKEFYPQAIRTVERCGNELFVPKRDRMNFKALEEEFSKGISKYAEYYEDDSGHANPRPFLYGKANGTSYTVSDPSQGDVLSGVDRKDLDLYSISRIMYSICSAIQNFHDNGLLYLDCKPDNIFLDNIDRQYHIRLFDFDTVKALRDIQAGTIGFASHSGEWSPKEQRLWAEKQCEIGKEADIYSVGAVFFYLLTGRKPKDGIGKVNSDIKQIEAGHFSWRDQSDLLQNCSSQVLELVKRIAAHTLQTAPSARYGDISRLKEDFQNLATLTRGDRIKDNSIYEELAELKKSMEALTEKNWTRDALDHISSPELKNALLTQQEKLAQLKDEYASANHAYQETPSPITRERLSVSSQALKRQREQMNQWLKDIISNVVLVSEYWQSGNDLDIREEEALEATAQGKYTRANYILRDPEWKDDIRSMSSVLEEAKARCRRYISGQKLLISNLRAMGADDESRKEIVSIYEEITGLVQEYQIEYPVLFDYASFLFTQHNYPKGIKIAQRLSQYYGLHDDVSNMEKARLDMLLGELYYFSYEYKASFRFCRRAAEALQKETQTEEIKLEKIRLYNTMADVCWRRHRSKEAKDRVIEVISLLESYEEPLNDKGKSILAHAYKRLATLENREWRLDQAEEYHLKALRIEEDLLSRNPEDDEWAQAVAITCSDVGIVYRRMKRYDKAEKAFKRSYELRKKGYMSNEAKFALGFAMTCSNYCIMLGYAGRVEEAEKMMDNIVFPIKKKLLEQSRDAYKKTYAISLNDLGEIFIFSDDRERWKRAEALFQESIQIKKELLEADYHAHVDALARAFRDYARLLSKMEMERAEEAESYFRQALDIYRKLEQDDPGYYEHETATASLGLAELLREKRGEREEAEALYRQALEVGRSLMKKACRYYREDYIATIKGLLQILSDREWGQAEMDRLNKELLRLEQEGGQ